MNQFHTILFYSASPSQCHCLSKKERKKRKKKKKAHVVHIDYTIIITHTSLFQIVLREFTQNIVQILLLETLLLSTVVNGNKTIVYCSTDRAILILAVLLFCADLQATGREISNAVSYTHLTLPTNHRV